MTYDQEGNLITPEYILAEKRGEFEEALRARCRERGVTLHTYSRNGEILYELGGHQTFGLRVVNGAIRMVEFQ